ncbi:hypothetical protein BAX51_03575 [Mycoplasmoides gallisepticum]|uniref:Uncharacterized protein n=2 Tax=Mycoplasmoides gallisepticum TaxID=2096 RepID=A0AB36DSK0_MYCGL|nr:hypothetical protein MGF_3171 [Mycoplasmoides gallisepticum str. F]AHB99671.1 hypothetical protein GCW_02220 [Mycoplasmoides gallisepticum S6]OBU78771.1 hypothetical protein BAY36_01885 [Mycoplasmoides gallisepticum]OBU79154.1 hypothetical protein BAY37_02360 [Mycoplasmoides gallisepticum]OBU79648.1 hypothetical protein BAX53_03670 [Mycoplasmoides gallisepticum]
MNMIIALVNILKNRLTYMNTNKIINSTIISLFIVLLTFLAIVFLVRINLYESYVFQKQDQKIQVNLTQDSQLAKFIQNNKAKYLIGYYKNDSSALKFMIDESNENQAILLSNQAIDQNVGMISFYLGKSLLYHHLIKSINL